jgi:hypothetical protein
VTDSVSNAGLANICVYLYSSPTAANASYATCTVSGGNYEFYDIPSGTYYAGFADPTGKYTTQWYNNETSQGTATAVTVPTGQQTLANVNAAMSQVQLGEVTGTVTDSVSNAGLANICVYLYSSPTAANASYATCTVSGGNYGIYDVASGTYYVAFADPTGKYTTQWYNDEPSQGTATAVTVPSGQATIPNINAAMSQVPFSNISGTVTDLGTGNPLGNIDVYVYPVASATPSYETTTASNGTYEVYDVTNGSYDVAFYDPTSAHTTRWYNGEANQASANAVTVPTGDQTVTGINAIMSP